jgi:hypothetical protein
MKKVLLITVIIALAAALPLAAKDNPVSVLIGAEAALENNFTQFGVGPWGDINIPIGKMEIEGYLGWTPYIQEPSVGSLFGEFNAYFHFYPAKNVSINPALCVSDYIWLRPFSQSVNIEPSIKFDIKNFFTKVCVPLQVYPEFVPYAYLEPGIHLRNLTLKLRGTVVLDPAAFDNLRWWADYAFGKWDIYTYGVVSELDGPINYNQYLGFYFGI